MKSFILLLLCTPVIAYAQRKELSLGIGNAVTTIPAALKDISNESARIASSVFNPAIEISLYFKGRRHLDYGCILMVSSSARTYKYQGRSTTHFDILPAVSMLPSVKYTFALHKRAEGFVSLNAGFSMIISKGYWVPLKDKNPVFAFTTGGSIGYKYALNGASSIFLMAMPTFIFMDGQYAYLNNYGLMTDAISKSATYLAMPISIGMVLQL